MCDNIVEYTIPKGWDYKTYDYKCGDTGVRGETVLCQSCEDKIDNGKMGHPDYCKHGVRYTQYDCDCWRCEMGE